MPLDRTTAIAPTRIEPTALLEDIQLEKQGEMVYLVAVAADISGSKRNIQLIFPARPPLHEVIHASEAVFTTLLRSGRVDEAMVRSMLHPRERYPHRGHTCPPPPTFLVDQMCVFEEASLSWVEVFSAAQLPTGCQLYCFSPPSQAGAIKAPSMEEDVSAPVVPSSSSRVGLVAEDLPGRIAPPEQTISFNEPSDKLGLGWRAAQSSTPTPVAGRGDDERLALVFSAALRAAGTTRSHLILSDLYSLSSSISTRHHHGSPLASWEEVLRREHRLSLQELFSMADLNRDGRLSFHEWVLFGAAHPELVTTTCSWLEQTPNAVRRSQPQTDSPMWMSRPSMDELYRTRYYKKCVGVTAGVGENRSLAAVKNAATSSCPLCGSPRPLRISDVRPWPGRHDRNGLTQSGATHSSLTEGDGTWARDCGTSDAINPRCFGGLFEGRRCEACRTIASRLKALGLSDCIS